MKKIWMLTDYKNHFGSKWDASPYRSGMDINLILEKFKERKYSLEVINFSDAANDSKIRTSDFVIYTSSEDSGYEYKSFIEDVVLYLENCGARTILALIICEQTTIKFTWSYCENSKFSKLITV